MNGACPSNLPKHQNNSIIYKPLKCKYLNKSNGQLLASEFFLPKVTGLKCGSVQAFRQSEHKLLGQHINSCSRVIHRLIYPVNQQFLLFFESKKCAMAEPRPQH
jgi:hypothetical protein